MLAPAFQPLFLLKFVSSNPPGQAFDLETDMSIYWLVFAVIYTIEINPCHITNVADFFEK